MFCWYNRTFTYIRFRVCGFVSIPKIVTILYLFYVLLNFGTKELEILTLLQIIIILTILYYICSFGFVWLSSFINYKIPKHYNLEFTNLKVHDVGANDN